VIEDISKSIIQQEKNKYASTNILEYIDLGYNAPVKTETPKSNKPLLGLIIKASERKPSKGSAKTFINP
jgi:hypothetical protein